MNPPGFTGRALAHRSFLIGGVLTLLGALRIAPQLVAIGSCGAMNCANTAKITKLRTTVKPSRALGRRRRRNHAV